MQNFKYLGFFIHCESANTRNGFKHIAMLYDESINLNNATVYYLNRTWETFTYQTVILRVLSDAINKILQKEINALKRANNYKRLNDTRRAFIATEIAGKTDKKSRLFRLVKTYNYYSDKTNKLTLQDAIKRAF